MERRPTLTVASSKVAGCPLPACLSLLSNRSEQPTRSRPSDRPRLPDGPWSSGHPTLPALPAPWPFPFRPERRTTHGSSPIRILIQCTARPIQPNKTTALSGLTARSLQHIRTAGSVRSSFYVKYVGPASSSFITRRIGRRNRKVVSDRWMKAAYRLGQTEEIEV